MQHYFCFNMGYEAVEMKNKFLCEDDDKETD